MTGRDRLGDRAFFLALLAFLLLSPPILTLFASGGRFFGVPLLIVYCFTIWFAAILAGRHVSASLRKTEYGHTNRPDDPAKPGGG